MVGQKSEPDSSAEAEQSRVRSDRPEEKLFLHAEELSIEKGQHETGRVRVSRTTHQRDVKVDENLFHDSFEVETRPIGKQVNSIPQVRREGDTVVVPVVEEVVVVEKRLMLKEELHIRRVRTTSRHEETVTLRYQEAAVSREGGEEAK